MLSSLSVPAILLSLLPGGSGETLAPHDPRPTLLGEGLYLHQPRVAALPTHDRNGYYFQVGAGLLTTTNSDGPGEEIDFDEGYAVPFALGYRFGEGDQDAFAVDVEFEGYWSDQDTDDPDGPINAVQDITTLSGLFNVVGNAEVTETLSLYGGGGLGLAFTDVGTQSDALNDFDDEDGPFLTWQLKAGLRWYASEHVSWNFGYRFVNLDDVEIDDDLGGADFDLETEQHVLEIGVRFGL